ncbi:MAG: hypothetical protein QY312_00120 [Candidatus Dojkabacteria bacterium]|nr:MAG: hypothetical protein QY312_00120 [Candidatus Dojkabacteria bacterium]
MAEKEKKTAHKTQIVELCPDPLFFQALSRFINTPHRKGSSEGIIPDEFIILSHKNAHDLAVINRFFYSAIANLGDRIESNDFSIEEIEKLLKFEREFTRTHRLIVVKNLRKIAISREKYFKADKTSNSKMKCIALGEIRDVFIKPFAIAIQDFTKIQATLGLPYTYGERITSNYPYMLAQKIAYIANYYLSAEDREKVMQILEGEFS